MKKLTTIICLFLITFYTNGQIDILIKIDTLNIVQDSTLVKISTYKNDVLLEEKTAFIFPETIIVPRYIFAKKLFKRKIEVLRILRHGETIEYGIDDKAVKSIFNYGRIINEVKIITSNNLRGPSGSNEIEYLIIGTNITNKN